MRSMKRLLEIMSQLREPGGCPWDREQTYATLKPQLVEECYELIDAIESNDMAGLREELGDLLLLVVFYSKIASEKKAFEFDDVVVGVIEKLVRRHPHVFGDVQVKDSADVLKNWHAIKKTEKPERTGFFDGIPRHLPALMRAHAVQKKAARVGFDWPDCAGPQDKLREEMEELSQDLHDKEKATEEMGDLLFAAVNLARHLKLDAEQCLGQAITKFQQRFERVDVLIKEESKKMEELSIEELDAVWERVKGEEDKVNAK